MSDLKDDWLDYEGLADLAAEEQLSAAPDGAEDRIYGKLMAAVGVPVGGELEMLEMGESAGGAADLLQGAAEAVSVTVPHVATTSAVVAGGSTVGGVTATVGSSALGAKGIALLLTLAGGGAALTVGLDANDSGTPTPAITAVTPTVSSSGHGERRLQAAQVAVPVIPKETRLAPDTLAVAVPTRGERIEQAHPKETQVPSRPQPVRPRADAPKRRPARIVEKTIETSAVPRGSGATSQAPAVVSKRDSALLAEQSLLRSARRSIAKRDFAGALISVRHHEISHPKGRLTEERELLRVQALVLAGRLDEADRAAARFRARFPESLMLKALDYVLKPDAGIQ